MRRWLLNKRIYKALVPCLKRSETFLDWSRSECRRRYISWLQIGNPERITWTPLSQKLMRHWRKWRLVENNSTTRLINKFPVGTNLLLNWKMGEEKKSASTPKAKPIRDGCQNLQCWLIVFRPKLKIIMIRETRRLCACQLRVLKDWICTQRRCNYQKSRKWVVFANVSFVFEFCFYCFRISDDW